MSEIAEEAAVSLELADFAALDSAGKTNIIGAGVDIVGFNPEAALTPAFGLIVTVTVPARFAGSECAMEIILENEAGDIVNLPSPTSEPQKMRVGQAVRFEETLRPGVPKGALPVRVRNVLAFTTGLPLAPGHRYTWRVRIDHDSQPGWSYAFYIPGPVPGPVLG